MSDVTALTMSARVPSVAASTLKTRGPRLVLSLIRARTQLRRLERRLHPHNAAVRPLRGSLGISEKMPEISRNRTCRSALCRLTQQANA
jgi:hypothetical protein